MAKVGWNEKKDKIDKVDVCFVIVDNQPHLNAQGVSNLLQKTSKLYIVTTNKQHPAYSVTDPNLQIIFYEDKIDFRDLLIKLKALGSERLTIQSGGGMNSALLRSGLVDYVSLVVAPIIVGGADTPTLVDGESLQSVNDLSQISTLELLSVDKLDNSYLNLKYKVIKN